MVLWICIILLNLIIWTIITFYISYLIICSDRAMLCAYSDIVLMGVGVLYLWASGPRLS